MNLIPKTKGELRLIILTLVEKRGVDANLNDIDTSQITDMAFLFRGIDFKGDISGWDVSKVKNMVFMFLNSSFDGDISDWNLSSIELFDKSDIFKKNFPELYI